LVGYAEGANTVASPHRKDMTMNWDQVEGNWKQMTGGIKSKWGDLTDDEISEIDGDREALEGKIQSKYGKNKEQAKQEVNDFINAL